MSTPPAFADAAQCWNRRYDGADFLFGTQTNEWLREQAHGLPPAGRVLCVADPPMRARWFERIVRCLKTGGVLILQGCTPKQLEYRSGGPPILSHLYTRDLRVSAFADLSTIELREYEAEVREGQGHSGLSALVDLVARR